MGKKIIIKGADFYQNSLPIPGEFRSEDFVGKWIQGSISKDDGSDIQNDEVCYVKSFVDVTDTGLNRIVANGCGLALVFYDTNKNFIDSVETPNESGYNFLSFTTPSETKYVRFVLWKPYVPITPTVADNLVWKVGKL